MDIPEQRAEVQGSRLGRLAARVPRGKATSAAVVISAISLGVSGVSWWESHRASSVAVREEEVALHLTWRSDVQDDGEVLALSQANPSLIVQGMELALPSIIRNDPIGLRPGELVLRSTWFEDGIERAFAACAQEDHVVLVMEPIPILIETRYAVGGTLRGVKELYALHYTASMQPHGVMTLTLTGLAPGNTQGQMGEVALAVANWHPQSCRTGTASRADR